MKKIGITGGKGGTGKSTVAVLTANKLVKEGKIVVVCDCDVECPNDYLLLGESLKQEKESIFGKFPELIKEKCTKCGTCVRTCRENAIFQPKDKDGNPDYPIFIRDLCTGCGACWNVCPVGAIKTKQEKIGKIYLNNIKKNYWLVTGEAKAGLEETGPIVDDTKNFAIEFAEKIGAKSHQDDEIYVIFDTAAGTHCPVISALLGVDKALAVTEPTPMGEYDLGLILDLCKKIKVPAEVILNQSDLGDKKMVGKIAKNFNTKIIKEIPYSKKLVENYSRGLLKNYEKSNFFKI